MLLTAGVERAFSPSFKVLIYWLLELATCWEGAETGFEEDSYLLGTGGDT